LGKKLQLPKNIKWLELVGGVALIIVAIKILINQFAYV
jgi:putative Mn2+ efflux pump MntP